MTLDELDGQTRLSYTTTADDHELVLAQELGTSVSWRDGECACEAVDAPLMPLRLVRGQLGNVLG